MAEKIREPVSVSVIFDHKKRKTLVSKVLWNNKVYKTSKQGLHHTYKKGGTVMHVFTAATDTISFRLILDSSSLIWTLDQAYDSGLG